MGTDAYQIQQTGLGNMKPMLYYQDIPVFRNDFVSKSEEVNCTSHTLSSITDNDTIVLGEASAADAAHLLIRGSDGILYRYEITAGAGTATIDVDQSGNFFDPESNKIIARPALNGGLFAGATDIKTCERIDGSSIYAGVWGEYKGVVGFTSANNAGLKLEYVGPRENENAYQYRLKWYCGFDLYNRLSLARVKGVLPLGA